MKRMALAASGVVLCLLGALWFLQGADLIRIRPLLCFADCAEISGGSWFWEVVGALAAAVGLLVLWTSFKRKASTVRRTLP